VPTVPAAAEPDVAVIPPAHDVALVGGSIFVHAHVPIDAHTTIGVDTSIYVRASMVAAVVTSAVVTSAVVTSAVVPTTVVTSPMASAVPFRISRRHDSKAERRNDRKHEANLLQHFVFLPVLGKSHHRTVATGS
jgi:hypothetical protein